MIIVLLGPPGSGKGTQADNIVKTFDLYKVSTGDVFREEVKNNTKLGKEIKNIIDKGHLVSDNIVNNLIKNILSHKMNKGIVFDGYPRNLNQAENLNVLVGKDKISCVLSLNVERDVVVKRILGRQVCSNCGLTFNKFFSPPSNSNHKCNPKFLT